MAQSAEEKEKEIKELTLKFEIEKQKNRKLQQEIEILKQSGRSYGCSQRRNPGPVVSHHPRRRGPRGRYIMHR